MWGIRVTAGRQRAAAMGENAKKNFGDRRVVWLIRTRSFAIQGGADVFGNDKLISLVYELVRWAVA